VVRRDIVDATHNPDLQSKYGENVILERAKDNIITISGIVIADDTHYGTIDTTQGFNRVYTLKNDSSS
jgi:hypothetical protein